MKNLTVIKASAGSGKTYTLAKRYIEYLLWDKGGKLRKDAGRYHEHMLAITFTNKATQEMKSRIVKELFALKEGKSDYMADFLKHHPSTSEADIETAAGKALAGILFGYSNFNVSTIDSFFQTVLRNFAHELDVDYNYEVELDAQLATRQAVDGFMHDLSNDRGQKYSREMQWIKDFLHEQMQKSDPSSRPDWNVFGGSGNRKNLQTLAGNLNKDFYRKYADEMHDFLKPEDSDKPTKLDDYKKLLQKLSVAAHVLYCGGAPESLTDLKADPAQLAKLPTRPEAFMQLLEGLDMKSGCALKALKEVRSDKEPSKAFVSYTIDDLIVPTDKTQTKSKCFNNCAMVSEERAQALIDFRDNVLFAYWLWQTFDGMIKNLWQLGMLGRISQKLDEYRRDNDVILLADTNELIGRVLQSGVPFVYERVGTWLNNFMIDEFQDTDRAQYDNFKPLIDDSLADGNGSLIIGDEKQSIYRFRGSDPQLLQEQIGKDFDGKIDDSLSLTTNYRSTDCIVEFNNGFFERALGSLTADGGKWPKLSVTYGKLKQQCNTKADLHPEGNERAGLVRVHLYDATLGDEQDTAASEHVLEILPHYILNLHERHGFRFSDMLLLVNKNKEGDAVVARLLEWNALHPEMLVPVMSEESLKLTNSPAVQFVVSVLRYIDSTQYRCADDDPDESTLTDAEREQRANEATLAETLHRKRLKEQLHYEVLHDFSQRVADADHELNSDELGQLLQDCFARTATLQASSVQAQDDHYAASIAQLLPDATTEMVSLSGLVDKIITTYGINRQPHETAFLLELQNQVINFTGQAASGGTVHEFLRWWDQKKDKLTIASGGDDQAVTVMTIHKAKGLEAPCVIIPMADWPLQKNEQELVWITREQLQQLTSRSALMPELDELKAKEACVPPIVPVSGSKLSKVAAYVPGLGEWVAGQAEDDLIDNVNKTYVAFTRPCQQMHIFSMPPRRENKNITNVNDLLSEQLPAMQGIETDDEADELVRSKVSYHFGELDDQKIETAKRDAEEAGRLSISNYPVHSMLPSLQVKLPQVVTPEEREGTGLHSAMSLLLTDADRDRAYRYALQRHIVQPDQYWTAARLDELLGHLVTDEKTRGWFASGNRVHCERPIVDADGQVHRPDRVVVTPDGRTIVIDYKFGARGLGDSETDRRALADYETEVGTYARLLRKAGSGPIEAYLYFARSRTVRPVAF